MQPLWAPWRMEFVERERPKGCIFCLFPAEARDRENLILGRSRHAFAILNKFPYNSGHLMVIPRRHGGDFTALPADELADLHLLLQTTVGLLRQAYRPDGFNLGMNVGSVAGAGIPDHLHYHVVPRWGADTKFMPVLAQTKVMIEHLDATWARLRPLFDAALAA